jgi:hypothetical protein
MMINKTVEEHLKNNYILDGSYIINDDGSVSVNGNCQLRKNRSIQIIFKEVTGYFDAEDRNLISLDGCPRTVGRNFSCNENKLTTLVGGPTTVYGDYYCNWNHLTDLIGAPATIQHTFDCSFNHMLTSLDGAPKSVRNLDLTSCSSIFPALNELQNINIKNELLAGDIYFPNLNFLDNVNCKTLVISVYKHLPLLRLLKFQHVYIYRDYHEIQKIIDPFFNKTPKKKAMLECQKALIDAGFTSNAYY